MNFSSLFILRPVMTTLVMVAFLFFGIISYFLLPVNDLPIVDFPTITVISNLPGANAETMASSIATPLEKQFSAIAGLESMNSTNALGVSNITMQFDLNRSIDGAAMDVQAAIIAARPYLPTTMPTPPLFKKANPADMPIFFISINSPSLPIYQVDEFAENLMAPRIAMVSGVAQVQVFGSQIYAPHVQVDPRKLAAYGIGIDEVASAIRSANVNMPTGTLHGPDKAFNIKANGQLFNAAAMSPVIVAYRNGLPVRISDVGTAIDSVQTDKVASWYKKTRSVILAVQRQPNTNTIQIVDEIKKILPQCRAIMPTSVNINVLYDRSISIRHSVHDVQVTLLITCILVVLVIFFFLEHPSTTIIASLSVPISIIGTFAFMKMYGFSLNNISLMALTLCVGFVVDDSIVVLENIVRHMEMGDTPLQAALKGSSEISFTIISMTLSLVAVFIPILLMGGIVGRLFFEFAMTMSTAIIISGFVSLTLTPMLCSYFLRLPEHGAKQNFMQRFAEWTFKGMLHAYDVTLQLAISHRRTVVALFALMLAATVWLVQIVPKGFMPTEDFGQIFGMTEGAQGISFEDMVKHQKKLAAIVAQVPDIEAFMSSVGANGPNTAGNQGRIFMVLKPRDQRRKLEEIVADVRKRTANIPGIKFYLQNPPSIRIGGNLTKALYQFTLSGPDKKELYPAAIALEKKMREMPGLLDVNSDLQIKDLHLSVEVDREKLSRFGLTMEQIQDALNSAYSQRQVSVIYTSDNQYWILLEVEPAYYREANMLNWLHVRSKTTGQLVPLKAIAHIHRDAGPQLINHLGQFPAVTISFNLKPDVPLGDAVAQVKAAAKEVTPPDVSANFQGTAQAFESSLKNLTFLFVIAILVIYIVLGCLYESFIHPLTILSGLPSAGLGALLILLAFHLPLDIYGFLGLILLVGIVKKNAIMMIDFAVDCRRNQSMKAEDAIYKACIVRFRPIIMTTMAALLGSLPIAIGLGAGSETRQPLGLTIVGGLLVSQLVTLYITPVFYIYLDRAQNWIASWKKTRTTAMPAAEATT